MFLQRALLSLAITVFALVPAHATPIEGPRSVGSFYSADDGASHAIVAKTNGDVVEAYWWDHTGVGSSTIAHFDNIAAVSGFWASWDGWRHAIVGLRNGQIWDVRFHPCCGIFPTLLTDLAGWGELKAISAWTDPQRHTNIAFLTRWGSGSVLGIHQQGGGSPTTTTFVSFYDNGSAIDVAGHYEIWNSTNMVTVAVGSPSRLAQIYWSSNQRPEQFIDIYPSTNTPWATRFPGAGQPAQTIVSVAASDQFCYFCPQWSGVEQIDLVTTTNQMKTFSVANGGGVLYNDWNFVYGPQVRSISGPYITPVGSSYRRNTLVMMSNGDVWNMQAPWSSATPSWTYRHVGRF